MRLRIGTKCRVVLEDGTTLVGTAARSWSPGVLRLNYVTAWAREGEVEAPAQSFFLLPKRRVLFAQVGAE